MYLAVCLGLFPAVPLLFIAELIVPTGTTSHAFEINAVFFGSWLVLAIIGVWMKTEARQTRLFLLLGSLLSVLVPVVNGLQTNDWLWNSMRNGHRYVLATDLFWLLTGMTTLAIYGSRQRNRQPALTGKTMRQDAQATTF